MSSMGFSDYVLEDYYGENKKKKQRRTILIICAVTLVGIGVGIGIGYAIGYNNTDSQSALPTVTTSPIKTTKKEDPEPIKTTTEKPLPPPYDKWLDVPCEEEYEGPQCPEGYSHPPLLLLSLDGFRAEYLLRNFTPNIAKLAKCGVHSPYMLPVFPTYTFPNHYSIVTGMYPEAHGIIANSMYDPILRKSFSLSSSEKLNPEWWEEGMPIWTTAEEHGIKTGHFFFPGSDVKIHGVRPSYWHLYEGDISYQQRIVQILSWLTLPEHLRPGFMTFYVDEPDSAGHSYGPEGEGTNEKLAELDGLIGELMDSIVQLNLQRCLDIIILADHGMAPISCNDTFFLVDHIETNDYYIRSGAITRLDPKDDDHDPYDTVNELQCTEGWENITTYTKWDLPKNWHYADHVRIEDIVMVSDEEYYISTSFDDPYWCSGGNHGYDHRGKQMESLFLAHGPSFKQNLKMDPFMNIELYPLMAEILGIPESPNNGTTGSLSHILRNPKPIPAPNLSGESQPGECDYPNDDSEYDDRQTQDDSGCTCDAESNLKLYDDRLDLTTSEVTDSHDKHLPFGVPVVNFTTSHCVLTQNNYVTGYDNSLRIPLWAAYTVDKQEGRVKQAVMEDCVRADVRVSPDDTPSCTDYVVNGTDVRHEKGFNVHPGLWENDDQMDTLITSNMYPMNPNFTTEIWDYMLENVLIWANLYNGVNVISGPLFDYNYDGHRDDEEVLSNHSDQSKFEDTWIPSHYYVIITRCPGDQEYGKDCEEDLEVLPFISRDSYGIETCQTQRRYIQLDIATVADIEHLTGLHFFPDLSIEKSIRLKLFQNQDIWPTT